MRTFDEIKPKNVSLPPVSHGGIVREELPLPYVHYPSHYGTFFAFSENESSQPFLCECSKSAIINFFDLRNQVVKSSQEYQYDVGNHFDQLNLPDSIVLTIKKNDGDPISELKFKRAICHRCNLTPPSKRFCHEMYGVTFIQYFGWYVDQTYLRFGILPHGVIYLNDVTPSELVRDIDKIIGTITELDKAWEWFRQREDIVRQRINDPSIVLPDVDFEEIARRQDILRKAQAKNRRVERELSKKIENIVREEFGYKKVGEQWTSETLLYQIVNRLFPDYKILRHYRPDWLEGLELDIFIPRIQLGIEYQGQQHFHPIDAWGGMDALIKLHERDARKLEICKTEGVTLVTVDYTEPLTLEYIRSILNFQ